MAYNPIQNTMSDQEMKKHLADKKAQSFSVQKAFEDGVYEFRRFNNALYVHQGEDNVRVLEFKLGESQNGARDIGLKIASGGDIDDATFCKCAPDDAARLALKLKNMAVNVAIGDKGYVQKPLALTAELANARAQMPLPQKPKKEEKKEEEKKPKKLWDDFLKDWVKMGVQVGGGFLLMLVLVGVFPAAVASWLFMGGLITFSFPNQLVDVGEKFVKKTWGKAVKFNKWLDYRADLKEFKRTQKDVWVSPTKVRKKAIKPMLEQPKPQIQNDLPRGKFAKLSKKKPLRKVHQNEMDLSAGM